MYMNSEQRYNGAIALILSQTNYTEDEAKEKLEKWEGKYINVIKEYLNPDFDKKKKEIKTRSNNEKMMSEIRNFMDTASQQYEKRKKEEERKKEYLKKVYANFLEVKKQIHKIVRLD